MGEVGTREVRLERIEDLADPRLAPYTTMTDAALRRRVDAEHGVFLAESSQVVRRALDTGHTPRSFLLGDRYRGSFADVLAAHPDVPVFTGPDDVLEALTGFHLHRGALAAMDRPAPRPLADVLADARRVLIAEDLVDHTNLGAVVRSAVAGVPAKGRDTMGVIFAKPDKRDRIVAVTLNNEQEMEAKADAEAEAGPDVPLDADIDPTDPVAAPEDALTQDAGEGADGGEQ